jgi:hypothetical protein
VPDFCCLWLIATIAVSNTSRVCWHFQTNVSHSKLYTWTNGCHGTGWHKGVTFIVPCHRCKPVALRFVLFHYILWELQKAIQPADLSASVSFIIQGVFSSKLGRYTGYPDYNFMIFLRPLTYSIWKYAAIFSVNILSNSYLTNFQQNEGIQLNVQKKQKIQHITTSS